MGQQILKFTIKIYQAQVGSQLNSYIFFRISMLFKQFQLIERYRNLPKKFINLDQVYYPNQIILEEKTYIDHFPLRNKDAKF